MTKRPKKEAPPGTVSRAKLVKTSLGALWHQLGTGQVQAENSGVYYVAVRCRRGANRHMVPPMGLKGGMFRCGKQLSPGVMG